jgi:hypothetical protein
MANVQTMIKVQAETNAEATERRAFKRGQCKAIGDMQHILNMAIHQSRMLGQKTPQLEEVRAALAAMLLAVD